MYYIIFALIIMALVTYLPRALPILVFNKKIKSNFIKSFLYYMPYAVLASLAFPSIFYSTGNIYVGIITSVTVVVASFFKKMKLFYIVALAVVLAYGLSYVF